MTWQAPHITRTRATQTRLPWWALALPTLAFVTLLTLVVAPGASAAPASEPLARLLGQFGQILRALPDIAGHFL